MKGKRFNWAGGSAKRGSNSRVERTYSDAYKAAVVKGMYDFWRGSTGAANLGQFLTGEAEMLQSVKPAGYDLGTELAATLRTLVSTNAAPGLEADEIGYLIRGREETFFEAGANLAGKATEVVTFGAFSPGDSGAITGGGGAFGTASEGLVDNLMNRLLPG